jgi:hypothetical protein
MATASKAITRIAEVAGVIPSAASRAARYLRETDTNLWPEGLAGRGQEAHVEPRHLVNLVLALAAADPITTAPETVATLRSATPVSCSVGDKEEDVSALRVTTLGDALDAFIERGIEFWSLTITRSKGCIWAHLYTTTSQTDSFGDQLLRETLFTPSNTLPPGEDGSLVHTVTVPPILLNTLGELWADTVKHRAKRAKRFSQS